MSHAPLNEEYLFIKTVCRLCKKKIKIDFIDFVLNLPYCDDCFRKINEDGKIPKKARPIK